MINVKRYRRIRDLREDADLTQRQVGEAINVPQRTYAYYESGESISNLMYKYRNKKKSSKKEKKKMQNSFQQLSLEDLMKGDNK